jgi:hypothetical protein
MREAKGSQYQYTDGYPSNSGGAIAFKEGSRPKAVGNQRAFRTTQEGFQMTQTGYSAPVTAPPIRSLIIQADGSYEVRTIEQSQRALEEAVGGTWEPWHTEYATFIFNNESKLHGMPFNPKGTFLWWKLCPEMEHIEGLRGPVIVTGPLDDGIDFQPIEEAVLDLFRRMESIRLERSITEDPEMPGERAP